MDSATIEIRDINSLADLKHSILMFREDSNYIVGTARLKGKNIKNEIQKIERQLFQELQEHENDLISAEAELHSCECYVPDEDEDHDCYSERNKVRQLQRLVAKAKQKHDRAKYILREADSVYSDFESKNRFFIELITSHTDKAVHTLSELMNDIFDYLGIGRKENTDAGSINVLDPNASVDSVPSDKRIVQVMYGEDGNPICNQKVSICLNNMSTVESVYTDENGRAILEGNINGVSGDVFVDNKKVYSGVLSNNMEYNKRGDGSVNHNFEIDGNHKFNSPYTKNDGTAGGTVESSIVNEDNGRGGDVRREESFDRGTYNLQHEIKNVSDGQKAESYNGWVKHKK